MDQTEIPINFLTRKELEEIIFSNNQLQFIPNNIGLIHNNKKIIMTIMYKHSQVVSQGGPYRLITFNKYIQVESERQILQLKILELVYLESFENGINDTITNALKSYRHFFKWIDDNCLEFTNEYNNCINLYSKYTQYLIDKYISGTIKQNTSALHQFYIRTLLNTVYTGVTKNIITIEQTHDYDNTEPYTKNEYEKLVTFYFGLFEQFSDVILNFKKFPFKVNYYNQHKWIFTTITQQSIAANIDTGEIYSKSDLLKNQIDKSNKQYQKTIYDLKYNLTKINNNYHISYRIMIAKYTMKFYIGVFLIETGMNESTANNLTLDNIKISHEEKEVLIITIKPKADYKVVDYQLSGSGYKKFIQYLKIREYLLNNMKYEYLFFTKTSKKITKGFYSDTNNVQVKQLFTDVPNLLPSKTRVNKGKLVYLDFGYKEASDALQHSNIIHFKIIWLQHMKR